MGKTNFGMDDEKNVENFRTKLLLLMKKIKRKHLTIMLQINPFYVRKQDPTQDTI